MKSLAYAAMLFIVFSYPVTSTAADRVSLRKDRLQNALIEIGAALLAHQNELPAKDRPDVVAGPQKLTRPSTTTIEIAKACKGDGHCFAKQASGGQVDELKAWAKESLEALLRKLIGAEKICEKWDVCRFCCHLATASDLVDLISTAYRPAKVAKAAIFEWVLQGGVEILQQTCACTCK